MRARTMMVLGCCLVAAACADRQSLPPEAAAPPLAPAAFTALTPREIGALIEQVVAQANNERTTALTQLHQIVALVTPPTIRMGAPQLSHLQLVDTAQARVLAIGLIQYIKGLYDAGALIGGQSAATQAACELLFNNILALVGLPPTFGAGSLGNDGATGFIYPTTQDTVVETGTGWAGVAVPNGSVTEPTIVTIQRLPDFPGPLLTPLDQYPIYYTFHSTAGQPFLNDVEVGVCTASNAAPPDPSRLRVAHNVGTAAVITPLAPASFLDCTNAPLAAASTRWGFDLARTGRSVGRGLMAVLLPQPLMAAPMFKATGGVGGTVREFSPFGAVDTLGTMAAVGVAEFHGKINTAATEGRPKVRVLSPTGRPMAGITVTFAVTQGGATIANGVTVTDANGYAQSGIFKMGPVKACSWAFATATMPAGSGIAPVKFWGCARL